MAAATRRRGRDGGLGARILEAALADAEERGWRAVRLVEIADRLDIPSARVLDHYRDKDAIADAWFRRGWDAMLGPMPEGFERWPPERRIEACLLAWFDALAPHRRVTAEMLRDKLHPSHPHHWVPMIFNLSRTIPWLREAARLPAAYGSRGAQREEVALTLLLLATLRTWVRDDSPGEQRTRDTLRRRLETAWRVLACSTRCKLPTSSTAC